jgi:hypothetical protein
MRRIILDLKRIKKKGRGGRKIRLIKKLNNRQKREREKGSKSRSLVGHQQQPFKIELKIPTAVYDTMCIVSYRIRGRVVVGLRFGEIYFFIIPRPVHNHHHNNNSSK